VFLNLFFDLWRRTKVRTTQAVLREAQAEKPVLLRNGGGDQAMKSEEKREVMMNPVGLTVTTPTDREIVMTRVFSAPRKLVFDAWTKPELVKRWLLGPPGWTMPVCEIDLRVGGKYRFEWRGQDGTVMGMGGVYREIVIPERIVNTQLFDEDWTGGETLGTLLFVERDGKTTLTNKVLYSSREARDGALKTDMAKGVEAGYARLDEIFRTMD
jgi:uncharacterized protein YndB with AHSA1/START domain